MADQSLSAGNSAAGQLAQSSLARLLPLKALIFAHHQIFEAVVADILKIAREEYRRNLDLFEAGFRADFAERIIIFDNGLDDGFQITEDGFWTLHRKMVPDEECPGHLIEGRFVEPVPPMSEFWSPWSVALAQLSLMLRSGKLSLWGRWNTRSAQLTRIAADIWPETPLGKNIDFENGTLSFPDGERLLTIQIEARPARGTAAAEGRANQTDAQLMASWMMEAWPNVLPNKYLQGQLKSSGRVLTNFIEEKREALSVISKQAPEIAARYARNNPKK